MADQQPDMDITEKAKEQDSSVPMLLISANVGSVFEDVSRLCLPLSPLFFFDKLSLVSESSFGPLPTHTTLYVVVIIV